MLTNNFTSKGAYWCCTTRTKAHKMPWFGLLKNYLVFLTLLLITLNSNSLSAQINIFDNDISDWIPVLNDASNPAKSFSRDANNTNDTQFTSGSQDPDLISGWGWDLGNTNDKGDISNAGAALIGSRLYFFGDRTAINGDAAIGFWFFQKRVTRNPNGTFTGTHTLGDLLILSNFTNGGGTVNLRVYEWVGSGGSDGTLNFLRETTNAHVNTVPILIPNNGPFDASRNGGLVGGDMWTYQGNNVPSEGVPPANTYHQGAFFEGFVNLNLNSDPCFTTFLLETRNSQSINASLQDFVMDEFGGVPFPPETTPIAYCVGEPTSQLTAMGTNLLWYDSPSDTTGDTVAPTPNSSVAGVLNYYVTQSYDNGCESERALLQVTVNPNPTCSIPNFTNPSCNGSNNGSITVSGSSGTPPYSFSLNGVTNATGVYSNLSANIAYTVAISDANGCESSCSITLTQPAILTCNAVQSSPVICNGQSNGSATVTPSGGNGGNTYLWDNGETSATATMLNAGPHTVTVTDSQGCTTSCEVTIGQPDLLTCSAVQSSPVICNGQSNGSATVTPSGGNGGNTYLWDNGETSATATMLNAGPHTVTVTDSQGCTTSCEVVIQQPDVLSCSIIDLRNRSCGESNDGGATVVVLGGTQPYSYLWDNGETNAIANLLSGGQHVVTVTDANGCATSCSVTIEADVCNLVCETAYARGVSNTCFIPTFANWGWTNLITPNTVNTMNLYAGAGQCNVSNGVLAGFVTVTHTTTPNGPRVTVTYTMNPTFSMSEAHLYIGSERFPKKGNKFTVAPGAYPYNAGTLNSLTSYTFGPVAVPAGNLYVIAHAVVCRPETTPTVAAKMSAENILIYPNPFQRDINIDYQFDYDTPVTIEVMDMQGFTIHTVTNRNYLKGAQESIHLDLAKSFGRLLFVKITTKDGVIIKKIVSTDK